jgi:hypothetical protein
VNAINFNFKGIKMLDINKQFKDIFKPDITQHPEYKLGQFHYQNDIPVKPSACVEYYIGYGNDYAQGECDSARCAQ